MNLAIIQEYLRSNRIDGWLLYDFRGSNPIALHLAGLQTSGSRRWFLWIPAHGDPVWLIHAIERGTFVNVRQELRGEMRIYVGWRQLEEMLPALTRGAARIAMEYSPENAIPYVSYVDAGMLELVRRTTAAEVVSSADLVQLTQAVLDAAQIASHRRAAAHCLAAKDAAFAYVAERLRSGAALNEYEVQQMVASHLTRAGLFFDHDAIVAVNANAALPHYAPSAGAHSPILPGDMLLIDLWGKEQNTPLDCYADITWVAYCGSQPPAIVQEIFATAAAGRDAAVAFVNERMAAGHTVYGYEVDDVCRGVIARDGYGDAFIHRTGHSLGVTTHFNGVNIDNLETRDRRSLMPGVMFTIEPGIYLPDFVFDPNLGRSGLGLRTEINCLVHADHVEVTTLPLQTEVIALL